MTAEEPKLNRVDLLNKVNEILRRNTNDPADELIRTGKALQEIGEALKGIPAAEARAVLTAVGNLN